MTKASREGALVRGLGSAVVLLVLLAGPPLALAAAVGWPLPTSIPHLDAIDRAARSGVSDAVIVKTLAIVAWLAWIQIAIALLVEIVGVVRGRPALRLPVLPGIQTAAARLVAGVAMMAATTHSAGGLATPPPLAARPAIVTVQPPTAPARIKSAVPIAAIRSVPATPAATVTVERHDSYWAIAERTLGDGLRWRELRDLNVGRTMNDGHTIPPGSDLLRPGWVLELPRDGQGTKPTTAGRNDSSNETADQSAEVTVKHGDNLWSIAEHHLAETLGRTPTDQEIRPYWQELINANGNRFVDHGNPSLVFAGQALTLPVTAGGSVGAQTAPMSPAALKPQPQGRPSTSPPPAHTSAPPTSRPSSASLKPTGPDSPTTSTSVQRTGRAAKSEAPSSGSNTAPTVIAVGGLASVALAAGAKRALDRRRRQFNAAHPGRTSHPTRVRERQLHRRIVANADEEGIDDLRSVIGMLARDLAAMSAACRPRIVQHSHDHLDVFLDHPLLDAPDGWDVEADGALWSLDPTSDRAPRTGDCAAPLLMTLGRPEDGAQLYLDLEADGLVALVGNPISARALARSIIAEAALSPLTDTVRIVVVGDLLDITTSSLDRVAVVDSWEEAENDACAWAQQSHDALIENGWPNTFVGRGFDPDHDALAPLLIVASEPAPVALIDTVTANQPAALAVVVVGELAESSCVIDCQPDTLTLRDVELTCIPQELENETLAAMIRLLETADEPEDDSFEPFDDDADFDDVEGHDVLGETESDDGPQLSPLRRTCSDEENAEPGDDRPDNSEPEYEILVRLLGDIRVEGGKPLLPKATAVVAYIALHRSVSVEALEDACWTDPALGSLRKRLKDVMSQCRAGVGAHHLPASIDGRYTVGPGIRTDTDLFDLRVARAGNQPPAERAETYRSALELVTGKVFSYTTRAGDSFGWIDTENLLSQWEVKIERVTQQCMKTYIAMGEPRQATEVAVHVLKALPLNAALTESLMRAHAEAGERNAIEAVFRAHAAGLVKLGTDSEPSTLELYKELTRRDG